jgi:type I restriction enzyme, S subunit
MSDLPPGWAWATIGELAHAVRGLTYKKEQARTEAGEGLAPLLRATNVQEGRLLTTEGLYFVPAALVGDDQWLQPGDVVIASSSGSATVVGKSAPLLQPWRGTFGAFCTVLRPDRHIEPRFVAHFVASPIVRHRWSGLAAGTNINNLKSAHVADTRVALPPLNEQRRIVAAIEEQFSRLDFADESLLTARAKRTALRRATLALAFSGGWPLVNLGELTDPSRPICYGILKPKTTGDLTIPYVEVRSIRNGAVDVASLHRTTQALHDEFKRSELRGGDVVLAIRGSFDRAAVVPPELTGANVSRDVARIAPSEELDPRYLAHLLESPLAFSYFSAAARGVAVRGVNIGDLRTMPIPTPPIDEQRRIVTELERQLSLIDAMGTALATARRRSNALRRSILLHAFHGELVPQDATEEPAAILLERIGAEHAAATPARRSRVSA